MARDTDVPEDELFRTEPDHFLDVRGQLAKAAKTAGDAEAAKRIAATRKPTLAAWVVNRHVLCAPDEVGRLLELGERLREAHADLDVDALRELTTERRTVVDELTRAALAGAGREDAPLSLREDVAATFDAAVADPEVAGRLGRLQRPEHWSGFGVATGDVPAGAPVLRLVKGGRDASATKQRPSRTSAPPTKQATKQTAKQAGTTAPTKTPDRTARRKVDAAWKALRTAEAELEDAEAAEQSAREKVRALTAQVTQLQQELDDARAAAEQARRAAKAARTRHREARGALTRAERAERKS